MENKSGKDELDWLPYIRTSAQANEFEATPMDSRRQLPASLPQTLQKRIRELKRVFTRNMRRNCEKMSKHLLIPITSSQPQ
jgi:hypothetical protein